MCTVSMIHDWAKNIPDPQWTRPMFNEYNELIRRLDEIDKKLGLANCEDPEKAAFIKRIEKRLNKLEKLVEKIEEKNESLR